MRDTNTEKISDMYQNPVEIFGLTMQTRIIISCAVVLLAYLVDFLCCKLLIPLIRKIAEKTAFRWDNHLTDNQVLHNVFHLIPPVTFMVALPMLFPEGGRWIVLASKILSIYIIVVTCMLACSFVNSMYALSSESEILKNKPMTMKTVSSQRMDRGVRFGSRCPK